MKSIVGVVLYGVLVSFALANTHETCKAKVPPRQAAVTENHGTFFFVYPGALGPTYSGCQTMWDEKGIPWFVLTFEKGKLVRYESMDSSKEGGKQICKYKSGKVVKNSSEECPEYDDVKDGLLTIPEADSPVVPPERDPRK